MAERVVWLTCLGLLCPLELVWHWQSILCCLHRWQHKGLAGRGIRRALLSALGLLMLGHDVGRGSGYV